MTGLQLRVTDFQDIDRWRWLLQDADGSYLADYQVALDPADPQYLGFVDLAGFLLERAVPDRRIESEAALVDRVGGWIGEHVLGPSVGRVLLDESPAVVRVTLPLEAEFLLHRPLELAHVEGLPLARQDVSLVLSIEGEARAAAKQPVGERLRMLAVFSLPTGGTMLALRRERYALTRLVRRIATRYERAIELHVLQYGVTRQRLQQALRDGRGWDLVHFSGHGLGRRAGAGTPRWDRRPGVDIGPAGAAATGPRPPEADHPLVVPVGCGDHGRDPPMAGACSTR